MFKTQYDLGVKAAFVYFKIAGGAPGIKGMSAGMSSGASSGSLPSLNAMTPLPGALGTGQMGKSMVQHLTPIQTNLGKLG